MALRGAPYRMNQMNWDALGLLIKYKTFGGTLGRYLFRTLNEGTTMTQKDNINIDNVNNFI